MKVIYDPILGKLRVADINSPAPPKIDGLILWLPLRDSADDQSANKLKPESGTFSFSDGWGIAGSQVRYDLSDFELTNITMTGNLQILLNTTRKNLFGIESAINTFYWQKRNGTRIVLETIHRSFDFDIEEADNGTIFHLSAVYVHDERTIYCYLNGILLNSAPWDLSFPGAYFNIWVSGSKVSDLRLYNKTLNQAEIDDIYQQDRRD